jgi:ribonuclease HI
VMAIWLGGFAKNVGNCSVYVAELWGVLEGLRFAIRMGHNFLDLNVDSLVVVQAS